LGNPLRRLKRKWEDSVRMDIGAQIMKMGDGGNCFRIMFNGGLWY
jgi:hypothetical protein